MFQCMQAKLKNATFFAVYVDCMYWKEGTLNMMQCVAPTAITGLTLTLTSTLALILTLTLMITEYWDRAGVGGNISYDW